MLLGRECFCTVLERSMGNPEIPVLYTAMVPCGLYTDFVGKRIWPRFIKVLIMLILLNFFMVTLYITYTGRLNSTIWCRKLFITPTATILYSIEKKISYYHWMLNIFFFVLLASNIIKINIYTTIDNVVFSMVWKYFPTGEPVMAIYDDAN